jgi:hypothetical protein
MNQAAAQSELDTDLQFGPPGLARVALRSEVIEEQRREDRGVNLPQK